jgi:hypothetical protein
MGAQGHLGQRPVGPQKQDQGGVEALTSGQFIALWTERVNRFMARKIEPPTHYVQHDSKAKKPTKAAVTDKKKTKVAAAEKKKT